MIACQQVTIKQEQQKAETPKMSKKITGIRIREDRAETLREKAIEMTIKKKEIVKESDLVNFLIDEFAERIELDEFGFLIKKETEEDKKKRKG